MNIDWTRAIEAISRMENQIPPGAITTSAVCEKFPEMGKKRAHYWLQKLARTEGYSEIKRGVLDGHHCIYVVPLDNQEGYDG